MFQRGLASLPDLEPSYVSSISWYFLVMYGLRSFFRLAIGDPSLEIRLQEQFLHQIGLQNANPNPGGKKQDAETMAKQLRQEAENLELQVISPSQKSELDSVERRLLGKRYPKKAFTKVVSSDSDFLLGGGSGGGGGAKSSSKSSKRKTQ
jgi:ER membrane protein complex subunit 3